MSTVLEPSVASPRATLTRERLPDADAKLRRTGGLHQEPFRIVSLELAAVVCLVVQTDVAIDAADARLPFCFPAIGAVTTVGEQYRAGTLRLDPQAVAAMMSWLREQRDRVRGGQA